MRKLKRHPVVVNLVLAFASALLASAWVNFFTAADAEHPMSDRKHLLILLALMVLAAQCWYNLTAASAEKKTVAGILDLGIRFFVAHAARPVTAQGLRAIVHLCEKARPGARLPRQRCLVPRYSKSPVPPRDFGAIPLDAEAFRKWYVNVRAFHEQRVVVAEPTADKRPAADDHFVSTPSLFTATSVIAAPVWSRGEAPSVIATLTFDAKYSLEELNWGSPDRLNEAVADMLTAMADLIGKILANDEASI